MWWPTQSIYELALVQKSQCETLTFSSAEQTWPAFCFYLCFCFALLCFVLFFPTYRGSLELSLCLFWKSCPRMWLAQSHISAWEQDSHIYLHSLVWLMVERFAVVFLKTKIYVAKLSEPFGQCSCNVI